MEKSVVYHLPLFESSQILSHVHLNDLRDYLDRESRDTRTELIGAGIVCGLHAQVVPGEDSITVQVSAGHGVTTDGYILGLKRNYAFTRYREYTDLADPKYLFGKNNPTPKPVLFELFEDDENVENAPLVDFDERETPELKDMVLVLYLEETKTDLKSCTGTNCDNKGKRDDRLIRVLLLDKTYLEPYNNEQLIRRTNAFAKLHVPRPLLHRLAPIDNDLKLRNAYQAVIFSMRGDIKNTMNNALNVLNIPLALNKNAWDVTRTKLDTFGNGHKYYQYSYDALCDIVHTYNDFIDAAEEFVRGCKKLVMPNLFPLHLVLHEFTYGTTALHDAYRTTFFNIQPVDEQDEKLVTAQLLYEKILLLINRYGPPAAKPVSITPSRYFYAPYSSWTIPAYFDLSTTSGLRLAQIWSPQQHLDGRSLEHFYYDQNIHNSDAADHLMNPFRYDKKPFPYYRVENLGGKKIIDAIKAVEELRELYGLNFDIKVATLEDVVAKGLPCGVEDLQEDYFFTRNKLLNIFDSVNDYIKLLMSYPEVKDFLAKEIDKGLTVEDILKAWEHLTSDIKNTLPLCLSDFNYLVFRDNYKKYADIIIKAIMNVAFADGGIKMLEGLALGSGKTVIDPPKEGAPELETTAAGLALSLASRTLFGLLRSFYFSHIYRIYYAYEIRRKKAQNRPHTLRDYIKAFPGLEHIAGTLENGTLLLVCTNVTAPAIGTSIKDEISEIDITPSRKPGIFGEITKNEFSDLLIKDISYDIGKLPDSTDTYIIRPKLTDEVYNELVATDPESPIVKRIIGLKEEAVASGEDLALNFYIKGGSIETSEPIVISPQTAEKIIEAENTVISQPDLNLAPENPLLDIEEGNISNVNIPKNLGGISGNNLIFRSPTVVPTRLAAPSFTTSEFKSIMAGKFTDPNSPPKDLALAAAMLLVDRGIILDSDVDLLVENILNEFIKLPKEPTTTQLIDVTASYLEGVNLLTADPVDPPPPSKTNEWLEKAGEILKEIIAGINKAPRTDPPKEEEPPAEVDRYVVADFFIGADTCPCECDDSCPDKKELAGLPIPPLAQTDFVIVNTNKSVEIFPEMNDVGIFGDSLEVIELADDKDVITEKGVKLGKVKHEDRTSFLYQAPPDYIGVDRFQYSIRNKENQLTDSAYVWILVNDPRKAPTISMTDTTLCFQDGPQLITLSAQGWDISQLTIVGSGVYRGKDGEWYFDPSNPDVVNGNNEIKLVEPATRKVWQTLNVTVSRIDPSITLVSSNWSDVTVDGIPQKRLTANFASVAPGADTYQWSVTYNSVTRTFFTSDITISLDVLPKVTHVDLEVSLYASSSGSGCGKMASKTFGFDNDKVNPFMNITGGPVYCKNDNTPFIIEITPNDWALNQIDVVGSGVTFKVTGSNGEKTYYFKPSLAILVSGFTRVELVNAVNGAVFQTVNLPVQEILADFELTTYHWFTDGISNNIMFSIANLTPLSQADTFSWYVDGNLRSKGPREFSATINAVELGKDFSALIRMEASMTDRPCIFVMEKVIFMPPDVPPTKDPIDTPPIIVNDPLFTIDPNRVLITDPNVLIQPVNTTQPTLSTETINLAQPVNVISPSNVVQPVNLTQPLVSPETVNLAQPVNVITPSTVVQPVNLTQPLVSPETVNLAQPLNVITQPSIIQPTETLITTQPLSPISTVTTQPVLNTSLLTPTPPPTPAAPDGVFLRDTFLAYVDSYSRLATSTDVTNAFASNATLTSRIAALKTSVAKMAASATPLAAVTETSVSTAGAMLKTLIAPISTLTDPERTAALKLSHDAMMLFWFLVANRKTDITSNTTFVGYANYVETTLIPFLQKNNFGIGRTDHRVFTEMALMSDKPSLQTRVIALAKL
jgi:hypothetical protein